MGKIDHCSTPDCRLPARISGVLDNYHRVEALANALKRQGAAMVRFNKVQSVQRSDPRRGKGQKEPIPAVLGGT